MKIYDCSATIYAEKLKSPEFGITIHTKIEAKNNNEAIELANNSFQKYCDALKNIIIINSYLLM